MSKKNVATQNEVAEVSTVVESTEPKIKPTAVEDRLYKLSEKVEKPAETKFRGKQRQIVFDIIRGAEGPMTIGQVAKLAAKAGLQAVGGVEPSCRYHLHHLQLDGYTEVTNPTTTLE